MAGDEEVYIVYDGECPVCSNYTRPVRLREAVGRVTILNAREDHEVVREIKRQGYDLDEGMVLKIGNDIHFGADAMHMSLPRFKCPLADRHRHGRYDRHSP